jgi:16S rRNA A1518/A1519 N6-dimethyltransferase RsmA/KsgA/DIM1 with predicted DNA glycosylase/AP lyase activity
VIELDRDLEALGIDPGARAETLELAQFIGIADAIGA